MLKQLFIARDYETDELSFTLFDNRYKMTTAADLLFVSAATDDELEKPLLFLSAEGQTSTKKIEVCPLNTINTD